MEDLDPNNPGVPLDWSIMTSDAEVAGFLQMTKAHPISLLLILHRNDSTRDTPEADATVPYFKPQHFDPPEMLDDQAEDTDALIRNTAGVGAPRLPIKDHMSRILVDTFSLDSHLGIVDHYCSKVVPWQKRW